MQYPRQRARAYASPRVSLAPPESPDFTVLTIALGYPLCLLDRRQTMLHDIVSGARAFSEVFAQRKTRRVALNHPRPADAPDCANL